MRYYFTDQNGEEKIFEVTKKSNEYLVNNKNVYVRVLGGKYFASFNNKNWFKITKLLPKELIISNTTTFKVYRGFKPSGLFATSQGALVTQMPGKIVKIFSKPGDKVTKGQTLLILEAMKMENEIKASIDGVIKSLDVKEGQAVDAGVVLGEIE